MSLEICSNGHDEIVYQQGGIMSGYRGCPLCDAIREIEGLEDEIRGLEITIADMESDNCQPEKK